MTRAANIRETEPVNMESPELGVVRALVPAQDGCLAEIERIGAGGGVVELARLDATGNARAMVRLGDMLGTLEQEIAARLLSGVSDAPDLVRAEGAGLVGLALSDPSALKTLRDGREGLFGPSAGSGPWWALVEHCAGADLLHLLHLSDGVRRLDCGPLRLDARRRITAIAFFDGALFVAVADPLAGFDLFRLDLAAPTGEWVTVLCRGAHRFALNAAVFAMRQTPAGLLIGTAALAGGVAPVGNWGPELLLVLPGGTWDLVMGQPRFTPDGLKLPASARLAGMDRAGNAAIKVIAQGLVEGCPATVVAVQDFDGANKADRAEVLADAMDYRGPVRFYLSHDPAEWRELPHALPDGLGEVTALCLTGRGLVIGHEALGASGLPVSFLPLP
ncbi:hypothetical protein EV663_101692 [Rhodovulum bhavnagarense]|uniref:Uncharacterized protein n=1 Tax=Rhodovulum bhavnagarense TaxID=992286 RepID=A0A4R2RK09_9RHOB|nr:hypothetical protein [Rhodovulum bhavnagarense]TCP63423.1 hypothetical protein EV663_101692 [Rhodovulum bhavnagarense]